MQMPQRCNSEVNSKVAINNRCIEYLVHAIVFKVLGRLVQYVLCYRHTFFKVCFNQLFSF